MREPAEILIDPDATDTQVMDAVAMVFMKSLRESERPRRWLEQRGLWDEESLRAMELGYADVALGKLVPRQDRPVGVMARRRLQRLGIYRKNGKPHLLGALVFPVRDSSGVIAGFFGSRFSGKLCPSTEKCPVAGDRNALWNHGVLNSLVAPRTLVVCSSMADVLACWVNGVRTTTWVLDDEHCHAVALILREAGVKRLLFPGNDPGIELDGLEQIPVRVPYGRGLWYYLKKSEFPKAALRELLDLKLNLLPPPVPDPPEEPAPVPAAEDGVVDEKGELRFAFGARGWRVRGLELDETWATLKVNLRIDLADRCHVDLVDLYSAKQRRKFISDAAEETGEHESAIKSDLGRILVGLEELREELVEKADASEPDPVESMSEEERREAMELLTSPDLLDRIVEDFRVCGLVGEDANALFGYVAATSRKLDDPISVIIQSSSSAGKSSLMEAIVEFVPPEEHMHVTAMTARSLYYVGRDALKHKTVSISESEGMDQAGYALKLLQSEKRLSIASTGRDSKTGRQVTHHYQVEGPIQTIVTTTAGEIDEELQNRSVVLTVGEDRAQTRAIQDMQRRSQTLEGMLMKLGRDRIVCRHRNSQRLLRRITVVNPHAGSLTFDCRRVRSRRDHVKFLNVICALTLLHQHQRTRSTTEIAGETIEYVEATMEDVRAAERLMADAMANSVADLAPQDARLLERITEMITEISMETGIPLDHVQVTRRRIRERVMMRNTTLGDRLRRLVEHEYLLVARGRHGRMFYRLPS